MEGRENRDDGIGFFINLLLFGRGLLLILAFLLSTRRNCV
jgi:hypothetical protein